MERHADDELGLLVAVDVAGGQRPAGLVLGVAVDAVAVGAERAERDGGAGGLALDHVGGAGVVVGPDRGDRDIVLAVAGPVARGDRPAGLGVAGRAVHPEAAVAEVGEVDVGRGGLAEHDVGRARVALADLRQPAVAAGGADRAEHEVAAAVAVDVARGHGVARAVAFAGAVDAEALRVGREVDLGRRGAAVDHARATGVRLGGRARIGPRGADQQVVLAVAVDVADAGQRPAGVVVGDRAFDADAVGAQRGEVDGSALRRLAVDHVDRARLGARRAVGAEHPHAERDVPDAVAVEVAGRGDLVADLGGRGRDCRCGRWIPSGGPPSHPR